MTKYSTISIPIDTRKLLEKAKGEEEWGEFILKLFTEAQRLRGKKSFEELTETLTEEDLKAITESSKELRERFAFR